MATKYKKVALSPNNRFALQVGNLVGWVGLTVAKIQHDRVDLTRIEPRNADIETNLGQSNLQLLELDRQ